MAEVEPVSHAATTMADTPRLVLRCWRAEDIAPIMAHLNTPAVMRWLGGVGDTTLYRSLFERMDASQRAHGHSFWIVERKADGALLGLCGLYRTARPGTPVDGLTEIGWRLREDAWGMGYAREAAEASLNLAFATLGLERVVAFTVRQNAPSWGLMQTLGMVRARELDHRLAGVDADIANHIVYAIDRKDWTQ